MNILYIGQSVDKVKTGADSVNKRNIQLLKNIFQDGLYIYNISENVNSFFEKITGYLGGLRKIDIGEIINLISINNIQCVFLSQSLYGRLCVTLLKNYPKLKIITFYHNIERQYALEFIRVSGIKHLPFYLSASYNEFLSAKYSNYHIVLNNRDSHLLRKLYNISSDLNLPVSYEDSFDVNKIVFNSTEDPFYLFVGTAFFANIQGVEYFINDILPHISGKFVVVGKGMEQFQEKWCSISSKVQVYGYVDDLSSFYYSATAVVAPIFSGGGMKTKIAEALMYGKNIIGTEEAFVGYEKLINGMYECNTSIEFIDLLRKKEIQNSFSSFNRDCRLLFKKNYENSAVQKSLENFFEGLD